MLRSTPAYMRPKSTGLLMMNQTATAPAVGVTGSVSAPEPAMFAQRRPPPFITKSVLVLQAYPCNVRIARNFARQQADAWGVGDGCVDTAILIVGELAANAAEHGGCEMTVTMWTAGTQLCVEVSDAGPRADSSGGGPEAQERGRGLSIVASLAEWCLVDRSPLWWRVRTAIRIGEPTAVLTV
ncbi:ATP-binding protein [Kitasatospora sp. NPDC001574]